MTSKQKTPKASPSQKQSNLETFVNQSDCITIPDSSQDIPSSPFCSDVLFTASPPQGKESTPTATATPTPTATPTATGARAEDIIVSLDALAIVKQANSTEQFDAPNVSLNSESLPISPETPTKEGNSKSAKKRARKPRSKTEMDLEWEKLREEKKEISAKNKEIERRIAELDREKEKLRKQIERNDEREKEKEMKSQERDSKLKKKEDLLDVRTRDREMKLKSKEILLQEKDNERNRIEEERIRKKDKEQAEQERFKNFFVSKPVSSKRQESYCPTLDSRFVPFQIKENMKLACMSYKQLDYEEFDAYLCSENPVFDSNTLLAEMKYRRHRNKTRTQAMEIHDQCEDDIVVVTDGGGDELCRTTQPVTVRFKLLQFVENQRPAYFGTFFKRSSLVTGRRPLGMDSTIMDYEVDSDLEWEPEDPDAESIKSNDSDEDVSGSQNDSDSEDGFFVPHGYLSADEGHDSEENDEDFVEKEMDAHASYEEKRKQKLEAKQEAWLTEITKKCQVLKPFIISRLSPIQLSIDSLNKINKCSAVLLVDDPLQLAPAPPGVPVRHKTVPDMINSTALPYFTQYIHEEIIGVDRAVMHFYIFWNEHYLPGKYVGTKPDDLTDLKVNKRRLTKTMHKVARKIDNKQWIVNEEFICSDMLDVNVKSEIKLLFPAKAVKTVEVVEKNPSPVREIATRPADVKNITKFVTPLPKVLFTNNKLTTPQQQQQQQETNKQKIDQKSIASFKRKSILDVKSVPEIPVSPPDIEMSQMKRVKLSTSSNNINSEIISVDTPPKQRPVDSRRLALGVKQTDANGTCIYVWK